MFFTVRPFGLLWIAAFCAVTSVLAIYGGWSVPDGRAWTLIAAGCALLIVSLALAWSALRMIGCWVWTVLSFGFRR